MQFILISLHLLPFPSILIFLLYHSHYSHCGFLFIISFLIRYSVFVSISFHSFLFPHSYFTIFRTVYFLYIFNHLRIDKNISSPIWNTNNLFPFDFRVSPLPLSLSLYRPILDSSWDRFEWFNCTIESRIIFSSRLGGAACAGGSSRPGTNRSWRRNRPIRCSRFRSSRLFKGGTATRGSAARAEAKSVASAPDWRPREAPNSEGTRTCRRPVWRSSKR